jgi:CheY-like chemotaxis protein
VDDNATNRRVLADVLAAWGMIPTAVSSAATALHVLAAARSPFHLAVLDGHMPDVDGFSLASQILETPAYGRPGLVLLTSGLRPSDAERCHALGIAAHLMKPAARDDLRAALERALSGDVAAPARVHTADASPREAPMRILLAEDNRVNQKFAVHLLEKRGHHVIVAADGHEAVAAFARNSVDVVLMDVQMPRMNGFEATAAIRKLPGGATVSIIALTADAMKGDEDKCLEAGMDAYLPKPLRPADLYQMLVDVSTKLLVGP